MITVRGKTTIGPNIVTDGLILSLDAGNTKSYPGSGTAWTELLLKNNGTLVNSPTFSNGSLVFNGSNTYVYSITNPVGIKGLQAFSLFIWAKATSASPSRRYLFDGRGNKQIATKNSGIGMGFDAGYSDNKIFHFMTGTDGTYTEASSPTTFLNNQIYQLGIVRDANSATFKVLDTDSKTLITPSFTAPRMTASSTVDMGEFVIGAYEGAVPGGNYWWTGNIYCIIGYNKALSQTEIDQNYTALKSRFGL